MKVLITGGSGFIGQYVTLELLKHGSEVINWDSKNGDYVLNKEGISERVDAIIHLAAQLEILDVNPIPEVVNNIQTTVHMLELARKFDVPRFIFASSACVYGEPRTLPSNEKHMLKPFWTYGSSKVAGEVYCKQYEELYGIKTISIRPSIITGIGEWYGRFVTLSMARVRQFEPILIFGNGQNTRDFCDVRDVARLFYAVTVNNFKTPEVFNGSSGTRTPIYEMSNIILRACAKLNVAIPEPATSWIDPKVGELGRKLHEGKNMHLDNSHAKNILNWEPKIPITKTIEDELRWLMRMPEEDYKKWKAVPRY